MTNFICRTFIVLCFLSCTCEYLLALNAKNETTALNIPKRLGKFTETFTYISLPNDTNRIRNFVLGTGNTKVVLYIDLYCHVCSKMLENVIKLAGNDRKSPSKQDIQIIVKPTGALGNKSYEAARYALACNAQNKFQYFFDKMHISGDVDTAISDNKQIDLELLKTDINNPHTIRIIETNNAEAEQLHKDLVPLIVIIKNGKQWFYPGFMTYENLETTLIM